MSEEAKIEKNREKWRKDARLFRLRNPDKKKAMDKAYQEKNKEKLKIYYKNRRLNNLDLFKEKDKQRRKNKTSEEKEIIAVKQKKYRLENADKIKAYRLENADKIREKRRIYNNNKSKEEIEFRLIKNLRSRTRFALKKWDTIKSDNTVLLLGCSISYFKEYFCSLFIENMNWEEFMNGNIHIDHIIPCIKFNLKNEDEQRKCFHYTNLQPLWKIDNLKKGIKCQ
jgi:hypothetical protein